jgi:class 3 adenylate cyclase
MSTIIHKLKGFARKPNDTEEVAFKKLLILVVAVSCCLCGLLWGLLYCVVFGFGLTAILPWCFVAIVAPMIVVSHQLKDIRPLIYAQLICITWISALIQWSIGSIADSGLVIAWSFLGPLGAMIFLSLRQSIVWMIMFLVIVVVSAVFDPALLGYSLFVPENARTLFYIMNLGVSTLVVFTAMVWFVNTIKFEKNRSETLLEKIRTLFGQHVSKDIANKLISKDLDETESAAFDVTIMFLDIRDFTVFADSRAPKEVENFQNKVFGEFINIVRANKGMVNQVLGDGILAIFGAPIVNETHASDAVKAGFEMIEKVRQLGKLGEIPEVKVGIGLHSGKIVAGEVGNEFRKFYSVAGSNVIIASRIEQLNKALDSQFLISEAVNERIKYQDISSTFHGKKELKGLAESVGIYQLL